MKRLVFERVGLQRFRSFQHSACFKLSKLGVGLTFLRGVNERSPRLDANGAGKTSLFEGVLWTLYGKTSQGLRNPDVTSWRGSGRTIGIVDFKINDKCYRVVRKTGPNSLTLNNRDVDQAAIERVLGMSLSVMTNAIIFPQNRPLFFDLEPRKKLELFDEVLKLDRWLKRSAAANKKLERRNEIARQLENDEAAAEREYDSIEDMLRDLQDKSKSWENERATLIQEEKVRVSEAGKRLGVLLDEYSTADLALDDAGTHLKFLRTDIKKAEHNLHLYADRVNAAKVRERVASNEIQRLKEILSLEGTCPTCQQPIRRNDVHKNHIRDKIAVLKQVTVSRKLIDKTEEARAVAVRLAKAEREFKDKEADARHVLDRVSPQLARAEATITAAKRAIGQHESAANPYRDQASDMRRKLGELKNELAENAQALIRIRRKIERTRFWVQGFKEVRLYVIDDILGELKMATDAVLDAMGLVGWEVRYSVEKETKQGDVSRALHVTVLSPDNDKAVRWEVWSGGEAQRLRLAGSLALAEVLLNHASIATNLEVLDEPSRGMSRGGISDLCDYLAQRAEQQGKTIVLTDHHALAAGRFHSVLTVTKDKRGSRLTYR